MIKKTLLFILCLFFLVSCGKKADPQYKAKSEHTIKEMLI